jgi:hypothetical protein
VLIGKLHQHEMAECRRLARIAGRDLEQSVRAAVHNLSEFSDRSAFPPLAVEQ